MKLRLLWLRLLWLRLFLLASSVARGDEGVAMAVSPSPGGSGATSITMCIGATDEHGVRAVVEPVHLHDFHATILHLMGLDPKRITYRLTDLHGDIVRGVLA